MLSTVLVILTSLILLVIGISYYNFKNRSKDPKVLFKDIHIPPTTKGTYRYWSYSENDTEVPKKE